MKPTQLHALADVRSSAGISIDRVYGHVGLVAHTPARNMVTNAFGRPRSCAATLLRALYTVWD